MVLYIYYIYIYFFIHSLECGEEFKIEAVGCFNDNYYSRLLTVQVRNL